MEKWQLIFVILQSFTAFLTSADIGIIQQIPKQQIVEVAEKDHITVKFRITADSFATISIMYGINGTRQLHHPDLALDYNASYSSIIHACNIDSVAECRELVIMVRGDKKINNTAFHLVMYEQLAPTNIAFIKVNNSFTIHVKATPTPEPATTTEEYITDANNSSEPSTSPPCINGIVEGGLRQQTKSNTDATLVIALYSIGLALALSCIANIALTSVLIRTKRSIKNNRYTVTSLELGP